eukprot:5372499-Prymnesium_polylepis.1
MVGRMVNGDADPISCCVARAVPMESDSWGPANQRMHALCCHVTRLSPAMPEMKRPAIIAGTISEGSNSGAAATIVVPSRIVASSSAPQRFRPKRSIATPATSVITRLGIEYIVKSQPMSLSVRPYTSWSWISSAPTAWNAK